METAEKRNRTYTKATLVTRAFGKANRIAQKIDHLKDAHQTAVNKYQRKLAELRDQHKEAQEAFNSLNNSYCRDEPADDLE